jgi:hypothetical protein
VVGLALHQLHLAVLGAVLVLVPRSRGWRRGWTAAAAVAALALLIRFHAPLVPPLPLERGPQRLLRYGPATEFPWWPRSDPWVDVQRWAAASTPIDALFLTPPDLEGFRSFSLRSHLVDWKQGTLSLLHPGFGAEWAERMRLLAPRRLDAWPIRNLARNYDALTAAEIQDLVTRFGITHVVVRRPRALGLPMVYENPAFRVYATQGEGGITAAPGT